MPNTELKTIIVPTSFVLEFAKRIEDGINYPNIRLREEKGSVYVQWTDGYALQEMRVRADNSYPNTSFITDVTTYATSFICETDALLRALAGAGKNEIMTLRVSAEKIEIETKVGRGFVSGKLEGEPVEILFNAAKLRTVLKLYAGKRFKREKQVCLQMNGAATPVRLFESGFPCDFSILMPAKKP